MSRRVAAAVALLAALAYFSTGLVVVAPGEAVVVRRLGRTLSRPWGPGLHWGWPRGLDRPDRVRTDEVRRVEVGLADAPGPKDEPGAGEFLTGDQNLMRARAVVQYRVADPVAFTLRVRDLDQLLPRLAESSLTRALSRRGIDAALRADRPAVAREVAADLASASTRLDLGLSILGVSLTDARPPAEVAPDFAAAESARSDLTRRLHEARSYASTSLTSARATAGSREDAARARASRVVALASARSSRFLALLAEADHSRPMTIRRLYAEAMRDLLPRVKRKLVLAGEEPVDLSIFGADQGRGAGNLPPSRP